MAAHACDPSTQETEAGDCCEFKTSLGHTVEGPCLENKQTKQKARKFMDMQQSSTDSKSLTLEVK